MTPEELMKPRYILENKWPGCQWEVGAIFPANFERFEIYPYLFRKLDWWEERKKSELPKYVKPSIGHDLEIMRVTGWDFTNNHVIFAYKKGRGLLQYHVPASKEEFLAQCKTTTL